MQQCLLPGDLLWVEGRSENWVAPFELPEVQSVLPKGYTLSPSEPVVFAHLSDREQAQRAESLRRRALAALYQQPAPLHVGTPRPEMSLASQHPLVDPEDLEVVHHKPERLRGALPEFMLFCTLSALVVVGWRGGVFAHLIQVRQPESSSATQRLDNESQHAAHALTIIPQPRVAGTPLPSKAAPAAGIASDSAQRKDSTVVAVARPARRSTARPLPGSVTTAAPETTALATQPVAETAAPARTEPRREQSTPANNNASNSLSGNPPAANSKDDKAPVTSSAASKTVGDSDEAPKTEKHRGFLRGLFKKKKKDETPTPDGGQ
ncbi:hypothetical protein [Flaviaesturariibacter terrae]